MANRLLKRYAVTYIPGTPAQPAVPGRWVSSGSQETQAPRLAGSKTPASTSNTAITVTVLQGGDLFINSPYLVSQGITDVIIRGVQSSTGVTTNKVYIPARPAVAGVPSRVTQTAQSGWNGGARSIDSLTGDGYIEFFFSPVLIGGLAGFAYGSDTVAFGEATHAFYRSFDSLHVVERGSIVFTVPDVGPGDEPTTRIQRAAGKVTYFVDGELVYTSEVESIGEVFIDVLLYTSDDYVENPGIFAVASASAEDSVAFDAGINPTIRASSTIKFDGAANLRAGDNVFARAESLLWLQTEAEARTTAQAFAETNIEFVGSTTENMARSVARYSSYNILAADEGGYARSVIRFTPASVSSAGGAPELNVGSSTAFYSSTEVNSEGVITGAAQSAAVVERFVMYSVDQDLFDDSWGRSTAVFEPHIVFSRDDPTPSSYRVDHALLLLDTYDLEDSQNMSFDSALELSSEFIAVAYAEDGWADLLVISGDADVMFDLDLAFASSMYLTDGSRPDGKNPIQIAVNAETGAVTTYREFGFLKIINTATGTYGVRADGVYSIQPGDDDGQPIQAALDLGSIGFGTPNMKRIASAYAGVATDGEVYFKFTDDLGNEYIYQAIGGDPIYRTFTGKGAFSRQWRVQLEIVDPTYVDLDGVQFDIGISARRIQRARK